MLKSVPGIYNGKIFYDSYPPNIIRIWKWIIDEWLSIN